MDSPTVPKAETVSKRYSTKKWRLSVGESFPPPAIRRTEVTTAIEKAEANMIEIDRLTISLGMVRLKIFCDLLVGHLGVKEPWRHKVLSRH
jgi:hypothetical protein